MTTAARPLQGTAGKGGFKFSLNNPPRGRPFWGQQEPLYIQAENGTNPCIMSKYGSEEFLLLSYEIQDAGTMKEGTVPVPPYRPCVWR
jgi:hypothetical protein